MKPFCLLAAVALMGCEGTLGVSLTGTPPEDVNAAVLHLTGITLNRDDGTSQSFSLDRTIDVLDLNRGALVSLISGESVAAGTYVSVELKIDADSQVLDSYLEDNSGGQTSLVLESGRTAKATADFSVRDEKDSQITLHLDLRSSLLPDANDADDRVLRPRLRLVDSADAGSISGDVNASALSNAGCDTSSEIGHVVYVFSGANITPDDLDASSPDPLTTSLLRLSDTVRDYVVSPLTAGDYTIAITCEATNDDPRNDDTISFVLTAQARVKAGEVTTLNFE